MCRCLRTAKTPTASLAHLNATAPAAPEEVARASPRFCVSWPNLDRTTSDLQAQIDQLNLALRQGREAPTRLHPLEQQLSRSHRALRRDSEPLGRYRSSTRARAQRTRKFAWASGARWNSGSNRIRSIACANFRPPSSVSGKRSARCTRRPSANFGSRPRRSTKRAWPPRTWRSVDSNRLTPAGGTRDRPSQTLGQLTADVHLAIAEMRRTAALPSGQPWRRFRSTTSCASTRKCATPGTPSPIGALRCRPTSLVVDSPARATHGRAVRTRHDGDRGSFPSRRAFIEADSNDRTADRRSNGKMRTRRRPVPTGSGGIGRSPRPPSG